MPTLKRLRRGGRNRRAATLSKRSARSAANVTISKCTFSTPNVDLEFAEAVSLKGIPQFLTNTSKLPTSASRPTPNTVTLVYDTPGSVTSITIPDRDPAIRSAGGGFCPAGNVLAPAP